MLSPLLLPLACTTHFKLLNKSEMLGQRLGFFFLLSVNLCAILLQNNSVSILVLSNTVLGLRSHGFSFACVSTDIL